MLQDDFVTEAASAFEARWTMLTLKRVDPDLFKALREQIELYYQATVHGNPADASRHGKGLARGYAAAVHVMEENQVEDDAYLVGRHNGLVVFISDQKAVQERVSDYAVTGERAILMSPDEVAMLFSSIEGLGAIAAIKQLFPGAVLIERYPDEPAKGD